MKKFLLLYFFLSFSAISAFSQVKLGLKFAPGIAFNRAVDQDPQDGIDIKGRGAGLRFVAGPEINFFLGENVAFTTGLWYSARRAGLRVFIPTQLSAIVEETYNLQYLQLPATLKLFTNEFIPNMRIYFQMGGTFDLKISEKQRLLTTDYIDRFRFFDTSLLIGSGVHIKLAENTQLILGLSYMRGLMNIVTRDGDLIHDGSEVTPKYKLANDLLGLDIGIRF